MPYFGEPVGRVKIQTTSKNAQRYYTIKRLIRDLLSNNCNVRGGELILGNPGATSRDDAIFSGESLLQVLRSPWELILTEPVPEVVEFRSSNWAEKYFSAQSASSSSRVTLSLSYTK